MCLKVLTYKCIKCGKEWDKEYLSEKDIQKDDDYFSHGLCRDCLILVLSPTIHRSQSRQGYSECFGKSNGNCKEEKCLYFEICNNQCSISK